MRIILQQVIAQWLSTDCQLSGFVQRDMREREVILYARTIQTEKYTSAYFKCQGIDRLSLLFFGARVL
jgi:hypothetical protein